MNFITQFLSIIKLQKDVFFNFFLLFFNCFRYLDNINSSDQKLRSQAERQAVNTVIQGSAADLIKVRSNVINFQV